MRVHNDVGHSVIAGAAKANPAAEGTLIGKAAKASLRDLKDEAARAKAAADRDADATRARIHRERRAGTCTDAEGAFTLHARGTVDEGSVVKAELDRLTDEIFRARSRTGGREERQAYVFDALVEMARRSAGTTSEIGSSQSGPRHLAAAPRRRRSVAGLHAGR